MNKKLIVTIVAFLWVLVAAGMILSKQYTLRTGKTITLETVPVDPRDFLRGDYVVLHYKISTLDLSQVKSNKSYYRFGEKIYVELEPREKFWEAVAIHEKKAATTGKLFIRGKVKYCYEKELEVAYGIESYFVPEGEGRDIERNMRGNKSSVSVDAIIDSSGSALIKRVYIDRTE